MDVITFKSRTRQEPGYGHFFFSVRTSSGFTLIELLLVLAVLAILSLLSAPAASRIVQDNRMAITVNRLTGLLAYLRTEAVKRGQDGVLCKSVDGLRCTKNDQWDSGWLAYIDRNRNRRVDADDLRLTAHPALPEGISLTLRAAGTSNYLVYRPDGSAGSNGTFTFCQRDQPELARALIFTRQGRVRFSKFAARGGPLRCED
jgi:type IV fimbrial biogenesis protein FimT